MSGTRGHILKFGAFGVVMVVLTAFLFMIFGQYRTGSTNAYSAVFVDVSGLKTGDSVRAGGLRVGTVADISMRPDHTVTVAFDADRTVVLSSGTRAAVRYLNLVGDRFLELIDGPGSARVMQPGSQIPADRTAPALDLDQLLGGLKPVIQGLNPQDVNALTNALLQIFQGQGGTVDSLLTKTASFSNGLADNNQIIEALIDNLNAVIGTLATSGSQFADAIDRFQRLVSELAAHRDPIGEAIDALDSGTTSIADLLGQARPPLAGTIDQLSRLAPLLDDQKGLLDGALQSAPDNYRKLVRLGAYGSWINYYICELTVRVTDLQNRTAVFPFIKQDNGRCAE
ncbi:MCE family protein [Mycolicibacterium aichiense]|uniref:Mammalian cell entry protein n=1 Tax=Mycolicibacterium aichiense TaxID=1799 RepID=A0AAD1MAT7_9MYCO|nr:MCE family protein [Mycolicibacterium aichiense]MCV7019827.1 MCE family protein [Mycolicibacterium aichiense]BBX06798.1 mammalian cell entry protein [Mycolicibacterium aichiense]STZ80613.1 virulence factor Mce family protein [Mycolicibacterium aichiense]